MKTLLGVLSIAALLLVSNVSAQDTTARADSILDVNKPSVGNDAFKDWQRPKALNNDSLMALGRGQSGLERSYNATKELVWNAVVETLSDLKIAVKKADKNKGDIESESEPRASEYYSCELHDKRGRPPREGFWLKGSKGKLVASIKEPSSSHTSLRIQLEGAKQGVDLGGYSGRLECQSTGKLEDTMFQRVEALLAGEK